METKAEVQQDKKRRKRAKVIAFFYMAGILSLLLIAWNDPYPPIEEEGMYLDLGTDAVGSGNDQSTPTPTTTTSPTTPQDVLTSEVDVTTPVETSPVETPVTTPTTTTTTTTTPSEPTTDDRAIFNSSLFGGGDGDDGQPGDAGDPMGQDNGGGGGQGQGYEGLGNRTRLDNSSLDNPGQQRGFVKVTYKVDPQGNVYDVAVVFGAETTIQSASYHTYAVNYVKKWKYNSSATGKHAKGAAIIEFTF